MFAYLYIQHFCDKGFNAVIICSAKIRHIEIREFFECFNTCVEGIVKKIRRQHLTKTYSNTSCYNWNHR